MENKNEKGLEKETEVESATESQTSTASGPIHSDKELVTLFSGATDVVNCTSKVTTSTETTATTTTVCELDACSSSTGLLKCASCHKVSYCTKDHQKSHWKLHKSDCFPAEVKKNEVLGRHLVATKDFKKGDLIFREKPIASGPSILQEDIPVCLSCYSVVQSGYYCRRCNWPVCNPTCEMDSKHASFECPVLAANQVSSSKMLGNDTILILRCLLMKGRNQKKFDQIMSLDSQIQERQSNANAMASLCTALAFIEEECGLDKYGYDIIDHVTGVVDVNGLGSDDRQGALLYRYASYLYFNGSMLSHDCIPNAYKVINLKSELELYASVPIKEGEVISTLYTESFLGTRERSKFLHDFFYFSCKCQRCEDPTEAGTMIQAIKCGMENCAMGYLLPENHLDEESEWKCNSCNATKSEEYILSLKNNFKKEIESQGEERSLVGVMKLETVLQKHTDVTFHPNHFLIVRLEYDIAQRLSFVFYKSKLSDVPRALMERYIELVRKILRIHDVLLPGFNRHRGRVLYFLQQGLHRLILSRMEKRMSSKSPTLKAELKRIFAEFLNIRNEGIRTLNIEPEGSEESYLVSAMAGNTNDIDQINAFLYST